MSTVRVSVKLKYDAVAKLDQKAYSIQATVLIPRQDKEQEESITFAAGGDHQCVQGLIQDLKKDKTVDLIATLTNSRLSATQVRIDRIEYQLSPAVDLL